MNQFVLRQGHSHKLQLFPHIVEVGTQKNVYIQLNSLPCSSTDHVRIYYIIDGKFEWCIHEQPHLLYPDDIALILPGQKFGDTKGFLEIGTLSSIHLNIQKLENGKVNFGKWSS